MLRARIARRSHATWGLLHPPVDVSWMRDVAPGQACVDDYGKVCIIIVSYNGLDYLRGCVTSLLTFTCYSNYQIIIVDNASQALVQDYLRQIQMTEPRIRVIFNDANIGFAAANNIGLRYASDRGFVVLLNSDTIASPGWLCGLLQYASRPEVGMVGPVTNWTGNEAKVAVGYRDVREMPAFAQARADTYAGQFFEIRMLAMYCVALRRAVLDQVGPLDERFGLGLFEDEDYARRVRQAGFRIICAEDVFVHHYGMSSFARLPEAEYRRLFERNRRLYEEKWGEPWSPHRVRA